MPERLTQQEDRAKQNWAVAVQTYHTALTAYRRLLETKTVREPTWRRGPEPVVRLTSGPPTLLVSHIEGLTPRELEVADLIALGYTNKQIADTLVLTRGTVANHVAHILCKLGAANRTQLAARVHDSRVLSHAN